MRLNQGVNYKSNHKRLGDEMVVERKYPKIKLCCMIFFPINKFSGCEGVWVMDRAIACGD